MGIKNRPEPEPAPKI